MRLKWRKNTVEMRMPKKIVTVKVEAEIKVPKRKTDIQNSSSSSTTFCSRWKASFRVLLIPRMLKASVDSVLPILSTVTGSMTVNVGEFKFQSSNLSLPSIVVVDLLAAAGVRRCLFALFGLRFSAGEPPCSQIGG